MKTLKLTFLVAALAACSHAQPVPEASAQTTPPPVQAAPPPPAPPPPVAKPAPVSIRVPSDSIYFDFDSADLKPEAENQLAGLGSIMQKHPDLKVRVEGNCDERGTEEYNIALGQRRADSAKKYLINMGASAGQMTTVSYGKDRPRAKGHDEDSWRQNRRDDFLPSSATVPQAPMSKNP
jgi:peptidoglycan-associated lipoprotein